MNFLSRKLKKNARIRKNNFGAMLVKANRACNITSEGGNASYQTMEVVKMMDFNQAIVALGFKPMTYPSRKIKENKLKAGMRRIQEKQEAFNRTVCRGQAPQVFVSGQWARPQQNGANRMYALVAKQDVYFTPNHVGGARRTEDAVDGLWNFFIDLDAGKDENGNYMQLGAVDERKKEMMARILKMPKATAVVETRNGYHVYWAMKPEVKLSLREWKAAQRRIIELTKSDSAVKDAARLLRMPYTFWVKADKGKYDTYLTRIVEVTTVDYTPHDLIERFEKVAEEIGGTNITIPTVRGDTSVGTVGAGGSHRDVANGNDNIAAIKKLDHQHFNSLIAPQTQRMMREAAVKHLKSNISLNAFLGLPDRFACIFHDDQNPSANIFKDSKSGHWLYKCHSSSCLVSGQMDIIDVTMAIAGVGFEKAFKFLVAAFGIILPRSKRGRHIDQLIQSNATTLQTIMSENKAYESKLRPVMDVYEALVAIAKETAEKTNTTYYGHDVYFAASKRYLANKLNTSDDKAYRKTVLLAALGLIEKVADDDLPFAIKSRDYLFRQNIEIIHGEDRTIQYYKLPAIHSLAAMTQTRKQLDRWIAGKGQIKNINRNMIAGIFGLGVAEAVYTKVKKEATTMPASIAIALN